MHRAVHPNRAQSIVGWDSVYRYTLWQHSTRDHNVSLARSAQNRITEQAKNEARRLHLGYNKRLRKRNLVSTFRKQHMPILQVSRVLARKAVCFTCLCVRTLTTANCSKPLGLSSACKLFLFFLLMLLSGTSTESQFILSSCMVPVAEERKLKRAPVDR